MPSSVYRRADMYEENILSVRLDDIAIITRATCTSASLIFFNVETRDRDLAIHANLHALLRNRCSDMFAFPHFLRKLSLLKSKLAK